MKADAESFVFLFKTTVQLVNVIVFLWVEFFLALVPQGYQRIQNIVKAVDFAVTDTWESAIRNPLTGNIFLVVFLVVALSFWISILYRVLAWTRLVFLFRVVWGAIFGRQQREINWATLQIRYIEPNDRQVQ